MTYPSDDEVPLIYTSRGNLPVDALEYKTQWVNTDDYIKFVETYSLNGEVVKESAHVYAKRGISTEALQQSF